MGETEGQSRAEEIATLYAQLDPQDIEQFYTGYRLWSIQQQIYSIQQQIEAVRQRQAENAQRLHELQPPAIALSTLALFQASGVNDIDLLDRMLERGEDWLDCTVQRLRYCEQFDFIRGNYTDWCEFALQGAYDWIDSINEEEASVTPEASIQDTEQDTASAHADNMSLAETTEEAFLQKLLSEEDEDTAKRPALSLASPVQTSSESEETVIAPPTEGEAHLAEIDSAVEVLASTEAEEIIVIPLATEEETVITSPVEEDEIHVSEANAHIETLTGLTEQDTEPERVAPTPILEAQTPDIVEIEVTDTADGIIPTEFIPLPDDTTIPSEEAAETEAPGINLLVGVPAVSEAQVQRITPHVEEQQAQPGSPEIAPAKRTFWQRVAALFRGD
jgi:hypothetical protein